MALSLTPHMLVAAYEYLRTTPPFRGWKLPEADDIEFQVTGHSDREGHYTRWIGTDHHFICISGKRIAFTDSLMQAMAHEMIHLRQALARTETPNTEHNSEFKTIARRACAVHGWDPYVFTGAPL